MNLRICICRRKRKGRGRRKGRTGEEAGGKLELEPRQSIVRRNWQRQEGSPRAASQCKGHFPGSWAALCWTGDHSRQEGKVPGTSITHYSYRRKCQGGVRSPQVADLTPHRDSLLPGG